MEYHGRKKILIVDNPAPQTEQLTRKLLDNNFIVEQCENAEKALKICTGDRPNIILLELYLADSSGRDIYNNLKSNLDTRTIPIIILTREVELHDRLRTMAMDIEDYIAKPYSAEEVIARIETILQDMEIIEESRISLKSGFTGHLPEMNLVDLIQTLELGSKSGIIHLSRAEKEGQVFINNGKVIDATFEGFDSARALMHMLTWLNGTFWVSLRNIGRSEMIKEENRAILKKGSKLIQQLRELSAQLPPLHTYLKNETNGNTDLPMFEKSVLAFFNEPKSIRESIEQSDYGDIRMLTEVKRLIEKGYLVEQVTEAKAEIVEDDYSKLTKSDAKRNSYSRLASFFSKKQKGKNPSPTNGTGQQEINISTENEPGHQAAVPHKIYFTKAELMLLRQKLDYE
jgi:CheY-like chemotaxis protein